MKNVAIRKNEREEILNKMVEASKPQQALLALHTKEGELAVKIREHILGKHAEAFLSLPEKFVPHADSIKIHDPETSKYVPLHFKFTGRSYSQWNGGSYHSEYKSVPCPSQTISTDSLPRKLKYALENLKDEEQSLKAEVKELKEMLKALIEGNPRTKSLMAILPETKAYFPEELFNRCYHAGLPALPSSVMADLKSKLA